MKRLHIHVKTDDLEQSIRFYTALFGQAPTKREDDYAKWLLDDPAANVSVSARGSKKAGVDHVGVSLDTKDELEAVAARLKDQDETLLAESETTCCYAKSNKYWARDPQGAVWELFQTYGDSAEFGAGPELDLAPAAKTGACGC